MPGIERISHPADPNRCKGATSNGQCQAVAVPGSVHCMVHGGAVASNKDKAHRVAQYQLTMYNAARVNDFTTDSKRLNGEVAILRMTLETILNQCRDATDLTINSAKISDLVVKVERLVTQMHKLDIATGSVLDKTTLALYADNVSRIIQRYVTDSTTLKAIVQDLATLVLNDGTLAIAPAPVSAQPLDPAMLDMCLPDEVE